MSPIFAFRDAAPPHAIATEAPPTSSISPQVTPAVIIALLQLAFMILIPVALWIHQAFISEPRTVPVFLGMTILECLYPKHFTH